MTVINSIKAEDPFERLFIRIGIIAKYVNTYVTQVFLHEKTTNSQEEYYLSCSQYTAIMFQAGMLVYKPDAERPAIALKLVDELKKYKAACLEPINRQCSKTFGGLLKNRIKEIKSVLDSFDSIVLDLEVYVEEQAEKRVVPFPSKPRLVVDNTE